MGISDVAQAQWPEATPAPTQPVLPAVLSLVVPAGLNERRYYAADDRPYVDVAIRSRGLVLMQIFAPVIVRSLQGFLSDYCELTVP